MRVIHAYYQQWQRLGRPWPSRPPAAVHQVIRYRARVAEKARADDERTTGEPIPVGAPQR